MFYGSEKAWLSQKGISFSDRDVTADEAALEELARLGVFSTPATLVDGELVVGFNRKKLAELLGVEE